MFELTTRFQMIDEEIFALRRAMRRLRDICAEADRLRQHCGEPLRLAAGPAIAALPGPTHPKAPRPAAPQAAAPKMPELITQALYSDNFVFRSATIQAARKG